MKRVVVMLTLAFQTFAVFAAHLRGGEITVQQDSTNPLSFQATLVLFHDPSSIPANAMDSAIIDWGDGNLDTIPRIGIEFISIEVHKSIYVGSHTYFSIQTDSVVLISYSGTNRVEGINNINSGNSVDLPMHFYTALNLKQLQFTTGNSTARFVSEIPIDAYVTVPLHHELQSFDADGDFYTIDTYVPMADSQTTVTNYEMPDAFGGTYSINGDQVQWITPTCLCRFSVGIRIDEFRNDKWLSTTFSRCVYLCRCSFRDVHKSPQINTNLS